MIEQITTLVETFTTIIFDPYKPLSEADRNTLAKLRELHEKSQISDNNSLLLEATPLGQAEIVRVFAVNALNANQITREQVLELKDHLLRDNSTSVQIAVARKMRQIPLGEVIPPLMTALVMSHDPQLQAILAFSIRDARAPIEWTEKVIHLLDVLKTAGLYREHLNMALLVSALQPPNDVLQESGKQHLLTNYLIEKALTLNNEGPMMGILAGLIIESVGYNIEKANNFVKEYRERQQKTSSPNIKHLIAELNSSYTLSELEAYLKETFQIPLEHISDQVRAMWEHSIKNSQKNISWRWWVSSLLIFLGVINFLGFLYFFYINHENAFVLAIVGLIIIIISIVYGDPAQDTKKNLSDIGITNSIYLAYMERTMAIRSGVFRLYLQGKLTTKEIKASNKMISEAMQETVDALRVNRTTSIEELINRLE